MSGVRVDAQGRRAAGCLDVSVVVPLFNEEDNVEPLYHSIVEALQPLSIEWEIVLVDDGSDDLTFARAAELAKSDVRLRVIKFRTNAGQTAAMMAGIDNARGKVLITMDGDLQNDPADIPMFLERIEQGYDVVVGWRFQRKDRVLTRKIPSKIANWVIGKVTGVPIRDNGCSLKAYRAQVIQNIPLYSEMHRFIPAMVSMTGAKIAEIKVRHHPRRHGQSKYGLSRVYKVLLDLLVIKSLISFLGRPLAWFGVLAIPAAAIGFGCLAFGLWEQFTIADSTSAIPISSVGVIFTALALFLILGGVLAELVYKTGDVRMDQMSGCTRKMDRNTGGLT